MLDRIQECEAPDLLGLRLARRRREAEAFIDREIARLGRARRRMDEVDADVLLAAIECFGSPEAAARWLASPEILLMDATPLDVAASAAGKEHVLGLLARLGLGAFT